MKSVMITAMMSLALTLAPGCATDPGEAPMTPLTGVALVQGSWSLRAITTQDPHPERSVVSANLALAADNTWRLRYDYHVAGTPLAHIWSSGLAGTWEAQPGNDPAVRFTVLDDGSTSIATVGSSGRLEVTLMGLEMRFDRSPE